VRRILRSFADDQDDTAAGSGWETTAFPRRTCIRTIEIAAGVTPGILLAWPMEIGRTELNFSTISRESPGRPYDISAGIFIPSSSAYRAASRCWRSM
jgi:hypothetical protein